MSKRACGACDLCCKLLPVKDINKPANTRCEYQHLAPGHGCSIYPLRPYSCAMWTCRWLKNPTATAALERPDISHYVIDVVPDYVTFRDDDTGAVKGRFPVLQVWCDPEHRDAHQDPALRELLEHYHAMALVRFSSSEAFLLAPPSVTGAGWVEKKSTQPPEPTHTGEQLRAVMGAMR